MPSFSWSAGAAVLLVCGACWTDLRWRRIPNGLTFPALGLGLVIHGATAGWEGLLGAILGLLLSPALLALLHAGRGFGMGDLKLVAALGSLLGPWTGILIVLVAAVVGGALAALRILIAFNVLHVPWRRAAAAPAASAEGPAPEEPVGTLTIPYGVAIGIGTLITLAATWLQGNASWLF